MGRIGRVIKSYIAKMSGSSTDAQHVSVEEFSGDQRTAQVFGACNEDFAPPNNCRTFNIPLGGGRGFLVSIAYHNQEIEPKAEPGERRLYSTNEAGDTLKAEIWLKKDGTIEINGDTNNLTMWQQLNSALQGLVTAINNHKHGGGVVLDSPLSLDITGAKANTLKTSG